MFTVYYERRRTTYGHQERRRREASPLADRVVVKALEETEQMRGGLYIPDTAKEKPQQGEIIAVGPGKYEDGKLRPDVASRLATRCCTGSTAAPKSRSTTSST